MWSFKLTEEHHLTGQGWRALADTRIPLAKSAVYTVIGVIIGRLGARLLPLYTRAGIASHCAQHLIDMRHIPRAISPGEQQILENFGRY